eukprot:gnl/Ergobibamus_cyprinoides/2154.p2 GENE.gnl/Ergobibamus_cyprinoides/2154~~gnl/Ergobibamus_cyprinoides/2154.p2  ORF type:complete len:195 (+),score=85.73 gnl/Ergobibamus_cyprinoides/2154:62-586(+)
MCAISNGIAAYGPLFRPFDATFLVFQSYALGAIRVGALSHLPVIHVFTHDSVFLGTDGPTHQPVETFAQMRSMPNMLLWRPADGKEVNGAYAAALLETRPSMMALSRQNLPQLAGTDAVLAGTHGAYTIVDATEPTLVIVATGSEVELAVNAAALLPAYRVRVVSAPCLGGFVL